MAETQGFGGEFCKGRVDTSLLFFFLILVILFCDYYRY